MVSCWRIVQERFSSEAFSGEGARLYGGRWNSPGHPVVYAAASRSLAVLEMLVHLEAPELLGRYLFFEAELPESLIAEFAVKDLPRNWRDDPVPKSAQAVGDGWIEKASSAVLRVPSVLIPEEHNFLLNPRHPGFREIRISAPLNFSFDPRLKARI